MKVKKKTLLTTLCIALMGLSSLGIGLIGSNPTNADNAKLVSIELQENYTFGTVFNAPTAKIEYKGKAYDTTVSLQYPDGERFSKVSYVLSQCGNYTLVYKAFADDGTLLEKTRSFIVANELFSVSSDKSTAYYGAHSVYAQGEKGIVVELAAGDTFTYNKIVDLSTQTRMDDFVSMFVTPSVYGVADVAEIKFRLTDIYDAENYVEIEVHSYSSGSTYAMAAPVGETLRGAYLQTEVTESTAWTNVVYDGVDYRVYAKPEKFGTPLGFSFSSVKNEGEKIGDRKLSLGYDFATHRVFVRPINYQSLDEMIVDLDAQEFFTNIWSGFTTGETVLSITGGSYKGGSFGFVVTNICDDDLSQDGLMENVPSFIEVDMLGLSTAPYGVVGVPYKVFGANVQTPITGVSVYAEKVYYNYQSTPVAVEIRNGYFTPTKKGIYTIEYSVTDAFAVKTVETVNVEVKDVNATTLTVSLINDAECSASVFENVKVKSLVVANQSGDYTTDIYVVAPSGTKYSVDQQTLTFIPREVGKHTVNYIVNDYILEKKAEYVLTVEKVDVPVFLDDAVLNKYYVTGGSYSFPILNVYYIDGTETKQAQAKLFVVNDCTHTGVCTCTRAEVDQTFTIAATKKLSLIYVGDVNGVICEKRYDVEAVDVGYGKVGALSAFDYFQTDETVSLQAVEASGENSVYVGESVPVDGETTFDFIHSVGVWNFDFSFTPNAIYNQYKAVEVLLIDSENEALKISVMLESEANSETVVYVNGRYVGRLFTALCGTTFQIVYMDSIKELSINGSINYTVEALANNQKFNGFESKKARLSLSVQEITGTYGIKVNKLNAYTFSSSKYERVSPSVYYEGYVENKVFAIGNVFQIPKFYVADVIDIRPTLSVSFLSPDGSPATAKDGTLLDGTQSYTQEYEVDAKVYGAYLLVYEAKDSSGNSTNKLIVQYNVVDRISPTIVLDKVQVEYGLGEEVSIAKASIVDDLSATENCTVEIFLKSPSRKYIRLTTDSFKAEETGEYIVYYFAYDELSNISVVKYTIIVA